jgi:hypothetical protein
MCTGPTSAPVSRAATRKAVAASSQSLGVTS